MAQEPKRGCGYRKCGGLYLVGGGIGVACDRLPYELSICPCCSQGVKQARGWTWIDVAKFFQGPHSLPVGAGSVAPPEKTWLCYCGGTRGCPLCLKPELLGKAGLLWIGEKFYKSPSDFVKEGVTLGFSRRIKAVPQGFKIGETWVLLAHAKAVPVDAVAGIPPVEDEDFKPGIFYVWLPSKLEMIFKESERGSEKVQAAEKRGITPVFFADDDKDHQGNVHDDLAREQQEAE